MTMDPQSKADAQKRADQIEAFRAELVRLEEEKVLALTDDQRRAVRERHDSLLGRLAETFDIDRSAQEKQLSLGMRIASFLGALAFAASVFFLFYQFWGRMSTTVQVSVLVLSPLLTLLATMWISARDASGYFTKLAALVSFACFVLNISMLGQIFNIAPSDNAFLVWGALAFLLAYAGDVRLLLAAGIVCFIGFISARTGTWSGMYWIHFGERPENFFPAAALLFALPIVANHRRFSGFAPVYRVFGLLTLFLPVLILSNWGRISYVNADPDVIEGFYQVAGFALSATAIGWGIRKRWRDTVNTGNVFFVIFLYTKFFDWWWDVMPKYLFFLVIGMTAVLFLVILKRLRSAGYLPGSEAGP
jgi:uncharacterized membrane protein